MTPNAYRKFWNILHFFSRVWHHIESKMFLRMVESCGENVYIPHDVKFYGYNVYIGDDVNIGSGAVLMCTRAPIYIGDHVMFGPNVTIVTGDHRTDIVGRYMTTVTDDEKLPENDQPVVFLGDNWIGTNVTILKGVTIGEGAIVAAGSLVNKDVPPYSIVGGVPCKVLKNRLKTED